MVDEFYPSLFGGWGVAFPRPLPSRRDHLLLHQRQSSISNLILYNVVTNQKFASGDQFIQRDGRTE